MTREETLKFIREGRSAIEWDLGPVLCQANVLSETVYPFYVSENGDFSWFTSSYFENKYGVEHTWKAKFDSSSQAKADCQSWYDNFLLSRATEV